MAVEPTAHQQPDPSGNGAKGRYACLALLILVVFFVWMFKDYYVYLQTRDVMADKDKKIAELTNALANTYCVTFKDRLAALQKDYDALKGAVVPPGDAEAMQRHQAALAAREGEMREQGGLLLKCLGRAEP